MSLPSRSLPPGFIAPCLPTSASRPPSGGLWLHEIKHDGFRVIARKEGKRVKLYSSQRRRSDVSRPRPLPLLPFLISVTFIFFVFARF
jgi:ATP-dependent DNA ligase